MVELTWKTALFGGMLIGLSATLLLAFNGGLRVLAVLSTC